MAECNLTRENLWLNEILLDSSVEQSVELDYLLPDYLPNIFKLLKTTITPQIQSQKAAGNKLFLDGVATIRVLYLPEESKNVCCIEQKMPFSKTVDLVSDCRDPMIHTSARCYFVNARAVNSRRLDIRGGISCKVRVIDQKMLPAVVSADSGVQLHTQSVSCCTERRHASKQFSVTEELALGHGKPPFQSILYQRCTAVPTDCRLIANKAVCKGDLLYHILYRPEGENAAPEVMEYSIPVSQIIDVPGIDDDFSCDVRFTPVGISCEAKADESGDNRILFCEFTVNLTCIGDKNQEFLLSDDVYAVGHEVAPISSPVNLQTHRKTLDQSSVFTQQLESESEISSVSDVFCTLNEYNFRSEGGSLLLSGMMEASVLCFDPDGVPFLIDKTLPVEIALEELPAEIDYTLYPSVDILSCGYTITSPHQIELRAELKILGALYQSSSQTVLTGLTLSDEAAAAQPSCALRLYFADAGEDIWEIAKRCRTSMNAILEENGLENEILAEKTMLLIPMVEQ